MQKIILDLCGGTGAWSKPYKEAGYDVRKITLPIYDVRDYSPPNNVYGILAAPPCTEFSLAKGAAARDFTTATEIVKACLNIIWCCRLRGGGVKVLGVRKSERLPKAVFRYTTLYV